MKLVILLQKSAIPFGWLGGIKTAIIHIVSAKINECGHFTI